MRLLRAYLLRRLLQGYAVAGLSLAALLWLLELLQLLEHATGGGVVLFEIAWQAARILPESLIDLLPVVVIVATTAVMARMNRDEEITVMRASGVSLWRISAIALLPALGLALLALAVLQWATPALYQGPTRIAGSSLGDEGLWHPSHGIWLRHERAFVNVARLEFGQVPSGIGIFEFDDAGRLRRQISAERAYLDVQAGWLLEQAVVRNFTPAGERQIFHHRQFTWESFLSATEFELLLRPPASLPLTDLWKYLATLRAREQETGEFALVLARRMTLPLACLGMALVAMAAAVVSMRSRAASLRVAAAMALGLCYQLLAEMVAYGSLVLALPPAPVAILPPMLLVAFGAWLLRRAR